MGKLWAFLILSTCQLPIAFSQESTTGRNDGGASGSCPMYATFYGSGKGAFSNIIIRLDENNLSNYDTSNLAYFPNVVNGIATDGNGVYGVLNGNPIHHFELNPPSDVELRGAAYNDGMFAHDAGDINSGIFYASSANYIISFPVSELYLNVYLNVSLNIKAKKVYEFPKGKAHQILDVAIDGNQLFASVIESGQQSVSKIYSIDLSVPNSEAKLVGTNIGIVITGLAFNSKGDLLGLSNRNILYLIDTASGQLNEQHTFKDSVFTSYSGFDLASSCGKDFQLPNIFTGIFGIRAKRDVYGSKFNQFVFIKEPKPLVDINSIEYYVAVPFGANPGGLGTFNSFSTEVCVALDDYIKNKYDEILNPNSANEASRLKTVREMKIVCKKLGGSTKTYVDGKFSMVGCEPISVPPYNDPSNLSDPSYNKKYPFIHRKHGLQVECADDSTNGPQ
ncbi:MAG: hypothetical protein QE271_10685 [Bacteriovoracaceae bacterium]|nr:hypothetical protein [Bacteriovoracaceae bacterium]